MILVTGATGNMGSELVRTLAGCGPAGPGPGPRQRSASSPSGRRPHPSEVGFQAIDLPLRSMTKVFLTLLDSRK
jgi:uncharacterized protein YbjT (DUF2867 family)